MRCPFCRVDKDRVVDSRAGEDGAAIRRRRECLNCQRRFTTYERLEESPLRVVKKDGRRVPYEREKLRRGIEKACWNLPISAEQIDGVVGAVEADALQKYEREIPSNYLGELIMRELRRLHQVAYIRFASVYREFKDVSEFMTVLEEFLKGRNAGGHATPPAAPAVPPKTAPPRNSTKGPA